MDTQANVPKILKNGAEVTDWYENEDGPIVLACTGQGPTPYVTWLMDKEGNAFWGHYFSNYKDAFRDFLGRVELHSKRGGH